MSLHEYYEEYWDRDQPTPLKDPLTRTRIALLREELGKNDHRILDVVVSLVALDRHFAPVGDHIRFFTDGALERLLNSNGFAVERIRHFGRFAPLWAGVFVWARKR
jgi:hypothetical protein